MNVPGKNTANVASIVTKPHRPGGKPVALTSQRTLGGVDLFQWPFLPLPEFQLREDLGLFL